MTMSTEKVLQGRRIVEGYVEGEALVTNDAISYMLYDLVKNGVGPLGIINAECESVAVIGAIVADLPMVDQIDISQIHTGDYVRMDATNGKITVISK